MGPDGLLPQFAKGGEKGKPDGDDGTIFEVTFTTEDFEPTSPTLIATTPTTVNHKLSATIFEDKMNPITLNGIKLVRVDVYPGVKAGKVTPIDMYFQTSNDPGSGTTYGTGLLPVDPPVTVSDDAFTLHMHVDGVEFRERHNSPSIGDAVYTPVIP